MRRFSLTVVRAFAGAIAVVALLCAGDAGAGLAVAAFARVPRSPGPSLAPAPMLVVFGDSLAYGYRATPGHGWVDLTRDRLARAAAGSAVVNASVCGARLADLRAQVAAAPPAFARAVLVVAGGNDLMDATDPFSLARADVALLRDIRTRYPRARVIVANVPDMSWRSFHLKRDGPAEPLPAPLRVGLGWLTQVDDAIVDRLARRSGAEVLDLHALTLEGDAETPGLKRISRAEFAARYVSFDGLHPNDRGYALLADFAWPLVARAMGVTQDARTHASEITR